MHYSDIDQVVKLQKVIKLIAEQYKKLPSKQVEYKRSDCGAPNGLTGGYGCTVSRHPDGSGSPIDLSGCYVGSEVYDAVECILEAKFNQCKKLLNDLGVDTYDIVLTQEK